MAHARQRRPLGQAYPRHITQVLSRVAELGVVSTLPKVWSDRMRELHLNSHVVGLALFRRFHDQDPLQYFGRGERDLQHFWDSELEAEANLVRLELLEFCGVAPTRVRSIGAYRDVPTSTIFRMTHASTTTLLGSAALHENNSVQGMLNDWSAVYGDEMSSVVDGAGCAVALTMPCSHACMLFRICRLRNVVAQGIRWSAHGFSTFRS